MSQSLFSLFILVVFSFAGIAQAGEQIIAGNFSGQPENGSLPDNWEPLLFDGIEKHTIYTHIFAGEAGIIQATSQASSSGLIRRIKIDPSLYPTISFRWKIQDSIPSADLTRKQGDDAPARVYITFAYDAAQVSWWEAVQFETIKLLYGEYPPISSLIYVWASHAEQGTILTSPYTSRVKVIVLESGAKRKGKWISEKRDIRADYRMAFGSDDIPMISGVAIMTDTDNTGEEAIAWYGDILFSNNDEKRYPTVPSDPSPKNNARTVFSDSMIKSSS